MKEPDSRILELLGALDDLWTEGAHDEAIAAAQRLAEAEPEVSAVHEKLAILRIHYAALSPPEDQLSPALLSLSRALELDPARTTAREIRANLFFLFAHQLNQPAYFQHALRDFLELEKNAPPHEPPARLTRWRLEGARAAFLSARNAAPAEGDYGLVLSLYSRMDQEALEATDWFFRGLAMQEAARPADDPEKFRFAAGCFLRAVELNAFEVEGRYFAADAFLSLEAPTQEELRQARRLVEELEQLPQKDFLMDALRERLKLRERLSGNELTDRES